MSDQPSEEEIKEGIEYQTLAKFLESTPPGQLTHISDLSDWRFPHGVAGSYNVMRSPEIQLHCEHENCNGIRFFKCVAGAEEILTTKEYTYFRLTYRCSNCQQVTKKFSLAAKVDADEKPQGVCYKFKELPPYGPRVPPKLIKLISPDRDEFLRGWRCENQGLGVGAFIYYKRVVENQKNRILEQIIKVSKKIGAPAGKIEILRNSVKETQFSKALEMAKDAIPESLLIDGHNPIYLLRGILSKDVHALTDEKCLKLAIGVRAVLDILSERLSQAMKDEAGLKKTLSTLLQKKKK